MLHEMRPKRPTEAHQDRGVRRARLLQFLPLRRLGDQCRRPPARGDAPRLLADHGGGRREQAAGGRRARRRPRRVSPPRSRGRSKTHPLIAISREEVGGLPPPNGTASSWRPVPSPRPRWRDAIQALTGEAELAFFDAIAPIVHAESIDMEVCWRQSRYDKAGPGGGGADYINCPLDKAQYEAFIAALLAAEKTAFKEFEATPYFEGCLPIEVMAERGPETLRYGPMKPVGLSNPHRPGVKPYAVVQLRQDNALGSLWNMVGFQTKLKHGEQAARVPHHPRPRAGRIRAARRASPQYLPQQPEASRWRLAAEGRSAAALRRTDHRRRGLCGIGGDRAHRRALRRGGTARAHARRRRRRPRRSARFSITSPAAISAPTPKRAPAASSR